VTRARRLLLTSLACLVFIVLGGATYQGVATALERRQFPYPGRMLDAGGHQLHLHCEGTGTPTTVLEAPAAGMSAAWGWVQPRLAAITRVCSYDRAGLGWSETGDAPYDPAAVPRQLHAVLQRAGERAPFLVVGQGLGAAFVTIFAGDFGGDVAGLVLIDPPSADAGDPSADRVTRLMNASPWLARAGVLRAMRILSDHAEGLPEPSAGALEAFLNRPDHLTRAARELADWNGAVALAASARLPGHVHVARHEVSGSDRLALLNDRARADTAASAIDGMIDRIRAR
jgi:pimeloyl-ACP methyl ester carboxylesterase